MRLLCVHPGASVSTHDVWAGLVPELEAQGAELVHYRLDARIDVAGGYLRYAWRKGGKRAERPSAADVLYWAGQGVIERALRHQVDWVLIFSAMYMHPDIIVMLRRAHQRVALLLTESPYDDLRAAPVVAAANLAWTNERSSLPFLSQVNSRVRYLRHAYDPARHSPGLLPGDETLPAHDVAFVGTGFAERVEALAGVDWTGIDLGIYGPWPLLGSRHRLRAYLRGQGPDGIVENRVAAGLYRRARIGLNLHRTSMGFGRNAPRVERAESMNPRDYELAACGLFFLSDHRSELEETLGSAVPTFKTPSELEALVRRYLADGPARAERAREVAERIAGHTFAARAAQVLEDLRSAS